MTKIPENLVIKVDPEQSAEDAGLRYTHDDSPGISLKSNGKKVEYFDPNGVKVKDEKTLSRIKSLVIPPAWKDVWICTKPNGHLQATGIDSRGRKQYRYHPKWREVRDENKYDRMIAFGYCLPRIREKISKDLALPGLPKEKILATIVQLLEKTLIRVGNEEYAEQNDSYGLTTMHNKHVKVRGNEVKFEFKGKSGVKHKISLTDKRLAKIIKKSQDIPGYELFQYFDEDGEKRTIDSSDVNDYLKEISGQDFTAKDFRTWHGTMLAAEALLKMDDFTSESQAKKLVVQAVEEVSSQLGNTKAVCRKCYIHPIIIERFLEGKLKTELKDAKSIQFEDGFTRLRKGEVEVISYLRRVTVNM